MHLFRSHQEPKKLADQLHERRTFVQNILLPCLLFSVITGIFTGALIFSFNLLSTSVIHFSSETYHFVRENPIYAPLLLLAVLALQIAEKSGRVNLDFIREKVGGSVPFINTIFPDPAGDDMPV